MQIEEDDSIEISFMMKILQKKKWKHWINKFLKHYCGNMLLVRKLSTKWDHIYRLGNSKLHIKRVTSKNWKFCLKNDATVTVT